VFNGKEIVKFVRSRSFLFSAINLTIIAALVYYLYINTDQYINLLHVSVPGIIILLVLASVFPFINGLINVYMFQGLGAVLVMRDAFFIAAASTLANELPVSGGIIAKGYYLKRLHNVSYTKFFSATLALFVCTVAVNGLIGLATLLYWLFIKKIVVPASLLFGFAMMAACFLIFYIPLEHLRIPNRMQQLTSQALEGWMIMNKNPALLLKLLGLQSILMLLLATRYYVAFRMLSQNISLGQVILFSSATVLTQLVSIAPGGLGVREAIVGAVSSSLGFDLGVSVAAVSLDRLVSTFFNVLVGWYSAILLSKRILKK
jgi:uncharacterized protein (TIRG00374 family)